MVLDQAKEVFDFCKTDCIDGMHCETISDSTLDEMHIVVNFSETCISNSHDHLLASLRILAFFQVNCNNPKCIVFYNERKNPERNRLDTVFNNCG
eukprot:5804550-Ditylum_brightwellii.AAC.1